MTNSSDSGSVVIRPRTSDDGARIGALAAESAQWHADQWPEEIGPAPSADSLSAAYAQVPMDDETTYFRLAEVDTVVVAFLLATLSPAPEGALEHYGGPVVAIADVAVTATARRSGIAALLMEDVEAWARSSRASTLTLQVHGNNVPARALYQRRGFRVSHVRMRKDL